MYNCTSIGAGTGRDGGGNVQVQDANWWTDQVVSTKVTAAATNNHRGAHLTLHVVTMFLSVHYI